MARTRWVAVASIRSDSRRSNGRSSPRVKRENDRPSIRAAPAAVASVAGPLRPTRSVSCGRRACRSRFALARNEPPQGRRPGRRVRGRHAGGKMAIRVGTTVLCCYNIREGRASLAAGRGTLPAPPAIIRPSHRVCTCSRTPHAHARTARPPPRSSPSSTRASASTRNSSAAWTTTSPPPAGTPAATSACTPRRRHVRLAGVSYFLLVFCASEWWQAVPLAVSVGLALAGIGFSVQHDGGHNAYSERPGSTSSWPRSSTSSGRLATTGTTSTTSFTTRSPTSTATTTT